MEHLRVTDRKFAQDFPIQLNIAPFEKPDEHAIGNPFRARRRIETDGPERTEDTFFLPAIAERMLTRLEDRLIRLCKRRMTQIHVSPCKGTNLLMSTMPNSATFYAHVLEVGNKMWKRCLLTRGNNKRTMQTLLPFCLLKEKVIPAITAEYPLPSSGPPNAFLGTAMRF